MDIPIQDNCLDCIHRDVCYKSAWQQDPCKDKIEERPQGKWDKQHTELLKYFVKCEKCSEEIMSSHKNFCPNCGAKLEDNKNVTDDIVIKNCTTCKHVDIDAYDISDRCVDCLENNVKNPKIRNDRKLWKYPKWEQK